MPPNSSTRPSEQIARHRGVQLGKGKIIYRSVMLAGDDACVFPILDRDRLDVVTDACNGLTAPKRQDEGTNAMSAIGCAHAMHSSVNLTPGQDGMAGLNYIRAQLGGVLQDALMRSAKEIDKICMFRDRSAQAAGDRQRAIRDFKEWSRADMGQVVGRAAKTVQSWERGLAWVGMNAWEIDDALGLRGVAVFIQNGDWRDLPEDVREFVVDKLLTRDWAD